jgi:CDP-paratose 2-epimerase
VKTAIVTGSAGLIGSEAARSLAQEGFRVVGIDNDLRASFFGPEASTRLTREGLQAELSAYQHESVDIRDSEAIDAIFARHGEDVSVVVHAAAQPSHDWAARDPKTDFGVNATGTLNMLEATRHRCPEAAFVFLSTNKVYGDLPNALPLDELDRRYEIIPGHAYSEGIDESMSLDQCTHSVFGVSKTAADLLVQEYGRYFDMKTACFRGGCLTGPAHAGTSLHGFLSYLMRCTVSGTPYTVIGYNGKQVRDNIHSYDLVRAILAFCESPGSGAVYNMGGGRANSCSVLEAIELCEEIADRKLEWSYHDEARIGDHIWWITDTSRFESQYPSWKRQYDLRRTLSEIRDAFVLQG